MTATAHTAAGDYSVAAPTSGASAVLALPPNTVDGNVLVCWHFHHLAGGTLSAPAGWTSFGVHGSTVGSFDAWYREVTDVSAEPSTYTFTRTSGSDRQVAIMHRLSEVDPADIVDAVGALVSSGTSSIAAPAAVPETDDGLLIACWVSSIQSGTANAVTAPAGMTPVATVAVTSGSSSTMTVAAEQLTASGDTGPRTAAVAPTGNAGTGFMVVVRSAAPTEIDVPLGRVSGTGTARPLEAIRVRPISRATGSGEAQPLTVEQLNIVSRVTGTGEARPLAVWKSAPGHVQMPALSIQAAFSVGADTGTLLHLDDPTRGHLDVGTLGDGTAEEPTWVELGERATEGDCQIVRGSSRVDSPMVTYETGTASLPLDNHDRALDPSNLSGPFVDPLNGKTRVTARRAVRIRATWADQVYELFRGTADQWLVEWQDPGHSITTLTASDGFKILAGISRAALVVPVGEGEKTGARINRVLDSARWGAEDRIVGAGDTTVQATTLEGEALTELQLVAATEIGELYVDGGGRVVFRGRNALLQDERSAVAQAVFGDGPGELPYKDLQQATDDATFANEVRVTRAAIPSTGDEGDTPDEPVEQVASDPTSQALFYTKTYTPDTAPILRTDGEALQYAQWLLAIAGEPEIRFTSIQIEPAVQPAQLWPHALGREIGDRITVIRRPPGGGDPITKDCFIRGITHEFGGESWTTTWTLQDATRQGGFFVLDELITGVLDANRLAY